MQVDEGHHQDLQGPVRNHRAAGNHRRRIPLIKQALTKSSEDTSVCPTWVPEDYTLVKVPVADSGLSKSYSALYDSACGEPLIHIARYSGNPVEYVEQAASDKTYSKNGVTYCLVTNDDNSGAGWQTGEYSCAITGKLSEDELKQIIDSIGE